MFVPLRSAYGTPKGAIVLFDLSANLSDATRICGMEAVCLDVVGHFLDVFMSVCFVVLIEQTW